MIRYDSERQDPDHPRRTTTEKFRDRTDRPEKTMLRDDSADPGRRRAAARNVLGETLITAAAIREKRIWAVIRSAP